MLIVYYLLMQEGKVLDKQELSNNVATWIKENFSVDADINIEIALEKLMNLQAPSDSGDGTSAVIEKVVSDQYQASSIDSAKRIIDYTWDNVFQYSNS